MSKSPVRIRRLPKLSPRASDAHKGHFGRVLVVGGSVGMVGAPALAANAALRGGSGLVKIACPSVAQQAIATLAPCATSRPLASTVDGLIAGKARADLLALAEQHDVLAVGPGMGQSAELRRIIASLLKHPDKPVVIDADGLNNLAAVRSWWRTCRALPVLTPHPGEMQRLLGGAGLKMSAAKREAAAIALADKTRAVVVLKGAGTVVTDVARIYVNRTGNPGMATAGSGDVLTGLVAAFLAQGLEPFEAAVLGVWAHGKAGDLAAAAKGQIALIAADLLEHLPQALRSVTRR